MSSLSTHVLDTGSGAPARGVRVTLSSRDGAPLGEDVTSDDGRIPSLGPGSLAPGDYVLTFDTAAYYAGAPAFYPEVVVVFTINGTAGQYHVTHLTSPF